MTGCDHCPLEEYVNGEDDVPVCSDACSDTWEEEFFDNLGPDDKGEDQDEGDSDNEQPVLNLKGVYKMLCKWRILWTIYLQYR